MIPKIIHYIWLGKKPLPELAEKCIASWKKYCPDYEIKRWDESNLDLDKYKFARDAYNAKKYAFASDVFRFDILNEEGGIYLDIDVELYKPLDDFLNYEFFTGFETAASVAPGLILGSVRSNKILTDLINYYKELKFDVNNLPSQTICLITTNYLQQSLGLKLNNETQTFNGGTVSVFSTEYFCPKSITDGKIRKTKNTVSIHWYNMSWYSPFQKFKHLCGQVLNFCTFGLFRKIQQRRKIQNAERKK